MRLKIIFYLVTLCFALSASGQQIHLENFGKARHTVKQKGIALLDLYTVEKGLTFTVGDVAVPVAEGDGYLTLSLPPKTTALLIQHPDYGQLHWKIPGKGLKKKKHYRADLVVESTEKDFRNPKQWTVIRVSPRRCVVQVDSTIHLLSDGYLSLYLPVGKHAIECTSPFFETLTDTLAVSDSLRLEKRYEMRPFYSFLEVKTAHAACPIYLDQELVGYGELRTGRIAPGRYHLQAMDEDYVYYDQWLELENAEKRYVEISAAPQAMRAHPALSADTDTVVTEFPVAEQQSVAPEVSAAPLVQIKAFNDSTEIWLNREHVGNGRWQGRLSPGFYAVSSVKEGLASRTTYFWAKAGKDMKVNLMAPMADYGMVNVVCDEPQAEVYLNGILVDETPCVLQQLPLHRSHHLRVVKGKRSEEKRVKLKGNDIVNVRFKLK